MESLNTITIKASEIDDIAIAVLDSITFTKNDINIGDIKHFEARACFIENLPSVIIQYNNKLEPLYLILTPSNLIKKNMHHNPDVRNLIDILASLKKLKLRSVNWIRPSNI